MNYKWGYSFISSAIVFIIYFTHPQKQAPQLADNEHTCTLNRIIDGDTIKVKCNKNNYTIRFNSIDAPEMAQDPWGNQAKQQLSKLIHNQIIIKTTGQDIYQRTLANVYNTDYSDLGLLMVEKGYARVYSEYHPPETYKKAMQTAKKAHLGIWYQKGLQQDPRRFRRLSQ